MTTDTTILRHDYQPPAWQIPEIDMVFELGIESTEVITTLQLKRASGLDAPLRLDGEGLQLLDLRLDGRPLSAQDYQQDASGLSITNVHDGSELQTRVRIHPATNTAFEGLYLAGTPEQGFLLTQCEAEGFRHITYFPDHPDILSRYTVTLRAQRERFPVLLAGGSPDGAGEHDDGRHWARFVDPWPRPSYLFALVAGHLEHIDRDFVTAQGRKVAITLWAETEVIDNCHYAMDALIRAMRWDEQTYGRCYDLDVFHVVATDAFNMGAMENKGLNIFNAKYLLADTDSSSDEDFHRIEAVIGHEYFHNWSGNRVTCRDWFQLSLKEGFTVFREQSFSAAMGSPALQRIDDVQRLRRAQFPEDAGPLAHPVRPDAYREINNFYTATVYEKGAELVRMQARRLGDAGFRRGTDLYFDRHDGQAVTIEDFVAALGDANHTDMSAYLAWYAQAGTPQLHVHAEYDAALKRLCIHARQHTAPTPGQPEKHALPIPIAMALFAADGSMLPLRLQGESAAAGTERVLELTATAQDFIFEDVLQPPAVSLFRGFSAPVALHCDQSNSDLAVLLRHDPDGFNRWQAGQRLAHRAFAACLANDQPNPALTPWCETLREVLTNGNADDALLGELLIAPDAIELGEALSELNPQAVHAARTALMFQLASHLGIDVLLARYMQIQAQDTHALDAAGRAARRLKRALLTLLCHLDPDQAGPLAQAQFDASMTMTDRLAALTALVHFGLDAADACLAAYRKRYTNNMLALDKWFTVQATRPNANALASVQALLADPAFTLHNPNRVQALIGSFARSNPLAFHQSNGAGYRFLVDQLVLLDALNPQTAARIATAFNGWQRLEPQRREHARAALSQLAAHDNSRGLAEIVQRTLGPSG